MPSVYRKYPDVVTPKDVEEMIRNQRAAEARRIGGKPEMTPYAIRCVKHGRVVLDWTAALGAMGGQEGACCPACLTQGKTVKCKLDQFWYEHTKDVLSAF